MTREGRPRRAHRPRDRPSTRASQRATSWWATSSASPAACRPSRTHITVDLQLFDQAVGSSALIKVDKVKATETLRLNVGTASTLGTVTSARDTVAELDLKKPVVAEDGGRVAISRRIAERWRLIGSGLVR